MSCTCLGEFNRPPIFNCVAEGLAHSNLNSFAYSKMLAPLRFIAALIISIVSPVFAAFDFLLYPAGCIVSLVAGYKDFALENLKDWGLLLLRFIPDAVCFPFVFAYNPDACLHYTERA